MSLPHSLDPQLALHLCMPTVLLPQNSWKNCGFDSILVPTTQKHNIVRLSNQFVNKLVTAADAPHGYADPQVLFDYRCYLPDGKEEIGTDYPPQIKQCLTRISNMTVQVISIC